MLLPYVIALMVGVSVALLIALVGEVAAARTRAPIDRQLDEIRRLGTNSFDRRSRRDRQARKERLKAVLQELGRQVEKHRSDPSELRELLMRAGHWKPGAVPFYLGLRTLLTVVLAGAMIIGGMIAGAGIVGLLVLTLLGGLAGWIAPRAYLAHRAGTRNREIQTSLADTLDLLVACVEAGMGLNQALLRVSEEMRHMSRAMSEELAVVNLEIRAGTPRDEALHNFGERTGLEDVKSLTAMLVQADRFGTSIGQALRVEAETLRSKRRQNAEEAAAKTTIKLVFPLVFFIFPALFVVILTPALFQIVEALGSL